MRVRWFAVLLVSVFAVGCSNAPIAGFLDACFPSRPRGPKPTDPPPDRVPPGDRIPAGDLLPPVGPVTPKN